MKWEISYDRLTPPHGNERAKQWLHLSLSPKGPASALVWHTSGSKLHQGIGVFKNQAGGRDLIMTLRVWLEDTILSCAKN